MGLSPVPRRDRDLRLEHVAQSELEGAIQRRECIVISGSKRGRRHVPLRDHATTGTVLDGMAGWFVHDSMVLLVRRDSSRVRPAWHETERSSERRDFMELPIEPGDVLVLPAVVW